ncbi:universal stress protein [Pseudomonas indica]|uniref:Nucleotide-binding universal stress protein, UspA family n=1 Tax=Pseudomonas indica TaxID=137658 RepID=A0A1G9BXJ7_9PSED|nr:universal stress protein [Pseudomonas indica]SDK43904.1 Nucleotide-binding universal stress protein, UspA family [Pseudomonas indica]
MYPFSSPSFAGRAADNELSVCPGSGFGRVVACIGSSEPVGKVIQHAAAMSRALNVPLVLLKVLETRAEGNRRLDPVDWDICCREAQARMEALARSYRELCPVVETEIIEGQPAEQISLHAISHPTDLTVLGTHGEWRASHWVLGDTAREVVERSPGSLLLVPCEAETVTAEGYRRVLVPVDGSCRAESVLPFAMRLAKVQNAELVLAHIVPPSALTEVGPPESEDIELCQQLLRRNERVARQYLDQLQARASENGVVARTLVQCADVRSSLARLVADETVDIVVLSAQGHSGRLDVPYGSVAGFLMTHASKPLLIMRQQPASMTQTCTGGRGAGVHSPLRGAW